MDNFEKLGFEVEVGGKNYTTALSRLDAIISRLDKINKLQNGQKLNKKGFEHFSKTGELTKADTKRAKRSGNVSVYQDLQKQIAKEIELNHIWKQQVETLTQLNLAKQKKITYDLITNDEGVKSANVQAEISKIMAKTAIDTGVLAKEEGKLAIAKQATAQYDKQSISNMARLQAEQKSLNDGKWEEARRIELANNARKKEIDQRLKQELGLKEEKKQVDKNTNSWSKYIAKITSAVAVARRIGHFISGAIQESANYIENLNLFAVAYGDVYQETLDWALNIADSFGLASNEVLKFAGTFRQLSTSLGLVENIANSVSKTVTNLGYDFSALFNTSVENAMDKLQSSLFSGNVRPLRAYGIDISQNQIDALFETNEALASLGVNARNLSQSDKVLARLIITLRDGSNAFGTMNREINTLQSQIRILQGSFSNFKLAIGDLVYEPIQRVLVVLNGFIIATTNIVRAFKPLTREDANPFNSIAMGAEDANDEIDNLQGKLAGFDKFNVLGGQNASGTRSAITDALVAELEKQQSIYEAQVNAMDDVTNKAKEMAERIRDWFIVVDENGKFLEWTTNAKAFSVIMGVVGVASLKKWASSAISAYEKATSLGKALEGTAKMGSLLKKVLTPKALGITLIVALIAYLYTTNEYFRESINQLLSALTPLIAMLFDLVNQILKPLLPMLASALNILGYILGFLVRLGAVIVRVGGVLISFFVTPLELVVKSLATIIYLFEALYSWNWGALGQKLSKLWSNWASINSISGSALFLTENNFGFANGGYTNANLIMTHENGKREAIMPQGKSNVILNNTQMTDIMETAVAKGVVLGNRALGNGQNGGGQVIHNHIYMNGRQIYESITETANQFGNTWAKR